jgi:hypothetical protein
MLRINQLSIPLYVTNVETGEEALEIVRTGSGL